MALPPRLPAAGTPAFRGGSRAPTPPTPKTTRTAGLPPRRSAPATAPAAGATADPEWQVRTAPSDTPGGPWVTHFRVWRPGVYAGAGAVTTPLLDLRFKDGHEHRYEVPHQVVTAAENDPTGGFVHRVLLGKGWNNKNRQARYPGWALN